MRHRLGWEDRTTNGTGFYLGSFFFCAPALNEMETHVVVTAVYRVCSPGAYCIFFFFSRLQAFDRVWEGVKQLVKGTACEKYVSEHLYR